MIVHYIINLLVSDGLYGAVCIQESQCLALPLCPAAVTSWNLFVKWLSLSQQMATPQLSFTSWEVRYRMYQICIYIFISSSTLEKTQQWTHSSEPGRPFRQAVVSGHRARGLFISGFSGSVLSINTSSFYSADAHNSCECAVSPVKPISKQLIYSSLSMWADSSHSSCKDSQLAAGLCITRCKRKWESPAYKQDQVSLLDPFWLKGLERFLYAFPLIIFLLQKWESLSLLIVILLIIIFVFRICKKADPNIRKMCNHFT